MNLKRETPKPPPVKVASAPKVAPKFYSPPPKEDGAVIEETSEIDGSEEKEQSSGKSRVDRINRLKAELVRELKLSAPSFAENVVREISRDLRLGKE